MRPGHENSAAAPIATVTTDVQGRFYVQLDPGTYCFVIGGRPAEPPATAKAAMRKCLEPYFKRCDAVANVTNKTDPVYVGLASQSPGPGQMFGPCDDTPPPP